MTTFPEDIEQRLKALEIEQEQQQVVLETGLSNFHEELRRLEKTLETIDSYIMAQGNSDYQMEYTDETEELEQKLKRMEEKERQQLSKFSQVKEKTK